MMKSIFGLFFLLAHWDAASASCPAPDKGYTVAVPGKPFAAIPSSDGCWLLVSVQTNVSRGAIVVLHNQEGHFAFDHKVDLDGSALGEALTPDGRLLVVAARTDTHILDAGRLERNEAGALLGSLHNGRGSGAIYAAVSIDGKTIFVSDEEEKRISVFDLAKAETQNFRDVAPVGHIPMGAEPVGLSLSPDGRWLYAVSEVGPTSLGKSRLCEPEMRGDHRHPPGILVVIDANKAAIDPAHALVSAFPAGCNPVRVVPSPDGTQIWITARGENKLIRLRSEDWASKPENLTSSSFAIGTSPVGIAVRPDGKQVWVTLSNRFGKSSAGQLVGISDASVASPTTILSAPAPGFPREITFLPDGRTIVATLFDASEIEIIPTPG